MSKKRPNCPECGASHIISRGVSWQCRQCGRKWRKVKRPKIDYSQRPPCPRCGTQEVTPWGPRRYKCNKCKRTFYAQYVNKESRDPLIPAEGIKNL